VGTTVADNTAADKVRIDERTDSSLAGNVGIADEPIEESKEPVQSTVGTGAAHEAETIIGSV